MLEKFKGLISNGLGIEDLSRPAPPTPEDTTSQRVPFDSLHDDYLDGDSSIGDLAETKGALQVRLVENEASGGCRVETPFGTWSSTPLMKHMLEKHPDAMLPLEETKRLFDNLDDRHLKELGIDDDKLRYYAFHATRVVEERLLGGGSISDEEKIALIKSEAKSWLDDAIRNFSQESSSRLMASLEETKHIFRDLTPEQLEGWGTSMDVLRRLVYYSKHMVVVPDRTETDVSSYVSRISRNLFFRQFDPSRCIYEKGIDDA